MDAAVEGFLVWARVERRLAANTCEAYARDLHRFARWAAAQGLTEPSRVEHPHVTAYLAHLADQGLSARSRNRARTSLRALFRFLVQEGHLVDDPTVLVGASKHVTPLPTVFSAAQVEALLAAPDRTTPLGLRDAAMIELMYSTGLRVSELVELAALAGAGAGGEQEAEEREEPQDSHGCTSTLQVSSLGEHLSRRRSPAPTRRGPASTQPPRARIWMV